MKAFVESPNLQANEAALDAAVAFVAYCLRCEGITPEQCEPGSILGAAIDALERAIMQ